MTDLEEKDQAMCNNKNTKCVNSKIERYIDMADSREFKFMNLMKSREVSENELCGLLPFALMKLDEGKVDFLLINNQHAIYPFSFLFKNGKRVNESKRLKHIQLIYEGVSIEAFLNWEKSKRTTING